jgi:hypothetical protein
MMDFDLKDVLDAVGPTASMVFASWIFMTLLQQRYSSGYDRYRSLVESYRQGLEGDRKRVIKGQILLYKRRIAYMRYATNLGLIAAILLIVSLLMGALEAMSDLPGVKYVGAACTIAGLLLVIAAAVLVMLQNLLLVHAIDGELADLADFTQ